MLELHCHTTYSDGTLTPAELVATAASSGVRALAVTDHDTMSGWDEAFAAAALHGIEIVPGLELSTVHNGRSLHILGFYPDANKLQVPLNDRLQGRFRRSQEMVEKLAAMGYAIELPKTSPGMAPGRPHIASALVKAGHAKSSREAFDRWLGDDGQAYVHYEKFSIAEGIDLLRSCGAVPVWAHPYLFRGGAVLLCYRFRCVLLIKSFVFQSVDEKILQVIHRLAKGPALAKTVLLPCEACLSKLEAR